MAIRREDLGEPLNRDDDPIFTTLFIEGIGGLLKLAEGQHGFCADRKTYCFKCELCHEIRRFLVVGKGHMLRELQPPVHYENR
ncbi:MAG: hypothetical protein ACWGN1_03910 [Desulfobulbales bacterium]